jgi:DNA polymerase I-like protein with 3'-5' exonuclease and polymerase domains
MVDSANLTGRIETVLGWPMHVGAEFNPRSLANFPMQANGAEMLRLACCLATERGIRVCAPVHDALLIEAPAAEIDERVAELQACMREANRVVLGGALELGRDAQVGRWPERYMDERGADMWGTVVQLLDEAARAS